MKRIKGLGGVFFRAGDSEKSTAWYKKHLGIPAESWGHTFEWRDAENPEKKGYSLWSIFKNDTTYIPASKNFMVNFIVEDFELLKNQLTEEGVEILGQEQSEFGKFMWILDPDGNKIELWEPVKEN